MRHIPVDVASDERRRPMRAGLTAAVVLAFLAGLLTVLPEVGAQNDDFSCSVEPADGGILVSWTAVDGAAQYQYKLDVDGRGSDYRRVSGTSVLIPLADGQSGTVGLAPIMDDGSGPARVSCGSASPQAGTGQQDLTCSVESANGGINVSWNEIRGAVSFAYRLDVPGKSSRYNRVTGTSTFIGLSDGVTGTVAMTPVFADGSTKARVLCGSGTPAVGTGAVDLTCSVVSDPGGLKVTWNNVSGAVTFGYKLQVDGRSSAYGRVNGTSAVIFLDPGVSGTISMNPVFADGSTVARTSCGTAVAGGNSGGGDPLTIATCTSSADGSDVAYGWTVAGDDEDVSNFRINYSVVRLEPGSGFSEVAREFDVDARTYRIGLRPGDVVTSSIQVTYGDLTRSAAVDCGTITIPVVEPELLTIADCSVSDSGNDVVWSWTTAGDQATASSYRLIYQVQEFEGLTFSEAATLVDTDLRSYAFELDPGDVVTGTIRVDYRGDNGQSETIDCGEVIIGGTISGPECRAFESPLAFSPITGADFYRITIASIGRDDRVFDVADNAPFEFTGEPGTVIDLSVQAFFPDGSFTLNTDCGSIRIPGEPVDPIRPVLLECSSGSSLQSVAAFISWSVEGDGADYQDYVVLYSVDRGDGDGFSGSATVADFPTTFAIIDLEPGDVVTSTVQITYADGSRSAAVDCGTATVQDVV